MDGRDRMNGVLPRLFRRRLYVLIADSHQAEVGNAGAAETTMEPHRRSFGPWAYLAISTFRSNIFAPQRDSVAICWPDCLTLTEL